MFSTCPWLVFYCQPSVHQQHMAATDKQTVVKSDEYGPKQGHLNKSDGLYYLVSLTSLYSACKNYWARPLILKNKFYLQKQHFSSKKHLFANFLLTINHLAVSSHLRPHVHGEHCTSLHDAAQLQSPNSGHECIYLLITFSNEIQNNGKVYVTVYFLVLRDFILAYKVNC